MTQPDSENHQFDLAVKFTNQTNCHLFLTGKAGTGKTTFLRFIKANTPKKLAVLAPTGVAAINAGGVTIHSFFQLPLGTFLPIEGSLPEGNFYNRKTLFKNLRLRSEKRKIIQELDLLIIDEVSMVRADLLDAIDAVLRYVRRQKNIAFGGVQVLFIGDLFQLPPVVHDAEWKILKNHYQSPFFFHSKALKETPPLFMELKKIYRQKDEIFINLLNNLRNNSVSKDDINLLNKYYLPDFKPEKKGEYITLSTHNYKADQINKKELDRLAGKLCCFEAVMEGDFNDKASPAEVNLQLKEGAQVMFIRNDKSEDRRYYNGKLATVKKIEGGKITVIFPDESGDLIVERETWRNVRYKYNSQTDYVEEEVIGKFIQFPIRLAWAITIHKSQGLTFNKAIIDAGDSFAPGQVYVALSRLTSLEGLILHSPIVPEAINTDKEAITFSSNECDTHAMTEKLVLSRKLYIHNLLINAFSWKKLSDSFGEFQKEMEHRGIPNIHEAKLIISNLLSKIRIQEATSDKFLTQLEHLLNQSDVAGYQAVHERVQAAGKYFTESLHKEVFIPIKEHFDKTKNLLRTRKYLKALLELSDLLKQKKNLLERMMNISSGLVKGTDQGELLHEWVLSRKKELENIPVIEERVPIQKLPKGHSQKLSLQLFKAGKSVNEIAAERHLVPGTIESHLISFIAKGELDIKKFMNEDKINKILGEIKVLGNNSSAILKEKLGDDFSFSEIRAVMFHYQRLSEHGEIKRL